MQGAICSEETRATPGENLTFLNLSDGEPVQLLYFKLCENREITELKNPLTYTLKVLKNRKVMLDFG